MVKRKRQRARRWSRENPGVGTLWGVNGLQPSEMKVWKRRQCHACGTTNPKTHWEDFRDDITYCPLHANAQRLLDALVALAEDGRLPEFCYSVIRAAKGRPSQGLGR